jgi:hypothetical protein
MPLPQTRLDTIAPASVAAPLKRIGQAWGRVAQRAHGSGCARAAIGVGGWESALILDLDTDRQWSFDLMPSWKANARHRRSEINACNTLTNRQADASCFWSSGCSMLIDE